MGQSSRSVLTLVSSRDCDEMDRIAPEFRDMIREHCRRCAGEGRDCIIAAMKRMMRGSDPGLD